MHQAAGVVLGAIIAIIFYAYGGYPVVLWVLGILKRTPVRRDDAYLPPVILIISAHNEERVIREKLENSLKIDYPKDRFKIVVASDGSVDATNDIVKEYVGPNVILKSFARREGKSATLNRAVVGLDAEVLVFSDANTFYQPDAVRKLVRNFADDEVGCVVGKLVYVTNHSYVGKGESLYWRYESLLNRLESRVKSVLVATGTIFAMRRELFGALHHDVANDFQLPAEVASRGFAVVYDGEAIAYERSSFYFHEEFARKRRIIVRGLTGYRSLRGNFGGVLRTFQFVSRKLLRWWVGPLLPVLYVANLVLIRDPFFLTLFLLQTLFYLFAAVGALLRRGGIQSMVLFVPFYFVMVNAASFAAIATYLGGKRLSAWEKAETTRDTDEDVKADARPKLRVIAGKKDVAPRKTKGVEKLERIT